MSETLKDYPTEIVYVILNQVFVVLKSQWNIFFRYRFIALNIKRELFSFNILSVSFSKG